MSFNHTTFTERLDEAHTWPCTYTFKFIVPKNRHNEVRCLFGPEASVRTTASRTGKYLSLTIETAMTSSDEVMAVYQQAAAIRGIIAL